MTPTTPHKLTLNQAIEMVDDDVLLFGSGFLMIACTEDGSRTYQRIPPENIKGILRCPSPSPTEL
jgi:hypothetical protein